LCLSLHYLLFFIIYFAKVSTEQQCREAVKWQELRLPFPQRCPGTELIKIQLLGGRVKSLLPEVVGLYALVLYEISPQSTLVIYQ